METTDEKLDFGLDPNARYCEWLTNKFGRDEVGEWNDPPITFAQWCRGGMPYCEPTFALTVECSDCGVTVPCDKRGPRKLVCVSCAAKRRKKNKDSWRQRQIVARLKAENRTRA